MQCNTIIIIKSSRIITYTLCAKIHITPWIGQPSPVDGSTTLSQHVWSSGFLRCGSHGIQTHPGALVGVPTASDQLWKLIFLQC